MLSFLCGLVTCSIDVTCKSVADVLHSQPAQAEATDKYALTVVASCFVPTNVDGIDTNVHFSDWPCG